MGGVELGTNSAKAVALGYALSEMTCLRSVSAEMPPDCIGVMARSDATRNWGIRCRDKDAAMKILQEARAICIAFAAYGMPMAYVQHLSQVAKQLFDRLSLCNLRPVHTSYGKSLAQGANHLTLKLKIAVLGWARGSNRPQDGPKTTSNDLKRPETEVEPIKKGGHGQCDDVSRSAPLSASDLVTLEHCSEQLFDALAPDPVT